MKLLFITTTLFLNVTFGIGQTDTTKFLEKKWTLGTILMSEQNSYFAKNFSPNYFNGIIFKRHFNSFIIRLGIEYATLINKKSEVVLPNQLNSEGYTKEGAIRLGIEKGITFKNHYRPYLAVDLMGIKSYSNKTIIGIYAGPEDKIVSNTIGFSAMPTIGFEFIMTKHLSFAYETRLQLNYTKTTTDINVFTDTGASNFRKTDEKFQKIYNRIGALTLNFNF